MRKIRIVIVLFIFLSVFMMISCKKNTDSNKHEHIYSEWKTVTQPTCTEKGLKTRFCMTCELEESEEIEPLGHIYNYYNELKPSIFNDGYIAHYECGRCGEMFDTEKNPITDVTIPKLDCKIDLVVNDEVVKQFEVNVDENSYKFLILTGISLKKDDVVKIVHSDTKEELNLFTRDGSNISEEGIVHNDADDVMITLDITPNGCMIFATGIVYEGIVINIYDTQGEFTTYPMQLVEYDSGSEHIKSYIYGYVELYEGESFVILDNDNHIEYGYDYISESLVWNDFDFTKDASGKIHIEKERRFGIEFIISNDEYEILINKVFEPKAVSDVEIQSHDGAKAYSLTKNVFSKGSSEYNEALKYLLDERTNNKNDILNYCEANGYVYYYINQYFDSGFKFNIHYGTNKVTNADHLDMIYGFDDLTNVVKLDGDYLEIIESGYYIITYTPVGDIITISKGFDTTPEAPYLFVYSDDMKQMTDNGEDATITNVRIKENDLVCIVNNETYYNDVIENDYAVPYVLSNIAFIKFTSSGVYDISINKDTKKITVSYVESFVPTAEYSYKLYKYPSITMEMVKSTTNEYEYLIEEVELNKGDICCIMAQDMSTAETYSYFALGNTSEAIASKATGLDFFLINSGNTYNVIFNVLTELVTIEISSENQKTYKLNYYLKSGKLDTTKVLAENTSDSNILELTNVICGKDEFFNVEDNLRNLYYEVETGSDLVTVGSGSATKTLVFNDYGVYNLSFDTKTHKFNIEYVRALTSEELEELTSLKPIESINVMKSGDYELIPFTQDGDNFILDDFRMDESGRVSLLDDDWVDVEFSLDESVDSSIATQSYNLNLKKAGIYKLTINKDTHILKVELKEELVEAFKCIIYANSSFYTMNEGEGDNFVYNNLELTKDTLIAFVDKNYENYTITLSSDIEEGLVSLSSKFVTIKKDGTYNISINSKTLEVLIVKVK